MEQIASKKGVTQSMGHDAADFRAGVDTQLGRLADIDSSLDIMADTLQPDPDEDKYVQVHGQKLRNISIATSRWHVKTYWLTYRAAVSGPACDSHRLARHPRGPR